MSSEASSGGVGVGVAASSSSVPVDVKSIKSFFDLSAKSAKAKGDLVPLSTYAGKVVLVVNVASKCGFTPQYAGLEALNKEYKDKGLQVLGFPCNQFGGQEPGDADAIESFCQVNYGVSFPVFGKIEVNGENADPIYQWLKNQKGGFLGLTRIKWNFEKFVINKKGQVVERFSSLTKPEQLKPLIEKLLKEE